MRQLLPLSRRPGVGLVCLSSAVAVALLTFSSLPAGAQTSPTSTPQDCAILQLGNPNPGDLLTPGGYVVSGVAYDPTSTQGAGIQRVDLFLGQRDQGGTILGSAMPGQTANGNGRAFQVQLTIPNVIRSDEFVAYAYSAVSSAQTSVAVPVNLGAPPAPTPVSNPMPATPVQLTDTVISQCATLAPSAPLPGVGLVSTTTSGTAVPTAQPSIATPQPVPGAASLTLPGQPPVLQLSNPGPGDLLNLGGYIVSGLAYDAAAPAGQSGVDRVDLFLDSRDQGGQSLKSTVPGQTASNPREFQVEVTIPSQMNGAHSFFAYAHSSITGQETVTSVPVFVGVPPTPTPRPS